MSETVYENTKDGVKLTLTRFWAGEENGVQITLSDDKNTLYIQLKAEEFFRMNESLEKNIELREDAWWTKLKEVGK